MIKSFRVYGSFRLFLLNIGEYLKRHNSKANSWRKYKKVLGSTFRHGKLPRNWEDCVPSLSQSVLLNPKLCRSPRVFLLIPALDFKEKWFYILYSVTATWTGVFTIIDCLQAPLFVETIIWNGIREVANQSNGRSKNIAKGTTDPGVDCFDQYFGLVGLVQYAW